MALKIDSPDIVHKSDVQGVALNVMSGASVRETYADMMERVGRGWRRDARINGVTVQKMARARRGREVSVGVVTDDPFGPVIVFGAGGVMIELIADRAMELPPLNQFLARRLIERARVAETLLRMARRQRRRHRRAGAGAAARVGDGVRAAAAARDGHQSDHRRRVRARSRWTRASSSTAARMASTGSPGSSRIWRSCPTRRASSSDCRCAAADTCTLRPIRPDDAQMLQDAGARPVAGKPLLPLRVVVQRAAVDDAVALHADRLRPRDGAGGGGAGTRVRTPSGDVVESDRIVGVSRYVITPDQQSCEFSLVVAEDMKGKGLGSRLMEGIMEVARERAWRRSSAWCCATTPRCSS